ncbi:hypothetical protein F9618_22875 [Escherichia coli]|nr:hypothetical protein [Escherichia coli]
MRQAHFLKGKDAMNHQLANLDFRDMVVVSGDRGAEMELQELLKNNLTYASEFLPTFSFTALAIIGAGRAYIISKEKGETRASISLQVEPYAIGSGGLIARTAMHCGKNAREAVQVAIDLDCYSGGSVDSFPAGKQTEGK